MDVIKFNHVYKEYNLYHEISYKEIVFNTFKKKKNEFKKKFLALEDVSFNIKKGESVAIVGKNGSGKSTTLGLIAGVLKPTKGNVSTTLSPSPLLELGGGFHPELNAYENIKLNGVLLGISLSKIESKIEDILTFGELDEFADQPIRTYSSGMLARLGFSIITQLDPRLLLIDEVLAVGDARFRQKCIDTMLCFKQLGVTIVFVSHNPEDIRVLCDRVIWIDDHHVKMDGRTQDVLPKYIQFMEH